MFIFILYFIYKMYIIYFIFKYKKPNIGLNIHVCKCAGQVTGLFRPQQYYQILCLPLFAQTEH